MTITVVAPKAILLTPVAQLLTYPGQVEVATRTCYKSEDRISEGSATRLIRGVIKRGHESVIEHCNVSYRFICSRAASHQIVRHRLCAFSQESMRYVDYGKKGFQVVVPPLILDDQAKLKEYMSFMEECYKKYISLRSSGMRPEDARFVLPQASKTELVMTANLREWRHVIKQRALNPHAQWEIRSLMKAVLYELSHYLPVFFEDLLEKKYD